MNFAIYDFDGCRGEGGNGGGNGGGDAGGSKVMEPVLAAIAHPPAYKG